MRLENAMRSLERDIDGEGIARRPLDAPLPGHGQRILLRGFRAHEVGDRLENGAGFLRRRRHLDPAGIGPGDLDHLAVGGHGDDLLAGRKRERFGDVDELAGSEGAGGRPDHDDLRGRIGRLERGRQNQQCQQQAGAPHHVPSRLIKSLLAPPLNRSRWRRTRGSSG